MTFLEKASINTISNQIDKEAYKKLLRLCPNLHSLKEEEFTEYKVKGKPTTDLAIGCKEISKDNSLYEISSLHEGTRVFTTLEICSKTKTANAISFEKRRDGIVQIIDAQETDPKKLNNLLYNLIGKGYKPTVIQTASRA